MAMSKCRECGKAVSTLAKTCPSCGVPKPAKVLKKKTSTKKITTKIKKDKTYVWAHCKSNSCKGFDRMLKISSSALGKRFCSTCGRYLREAKDTETRAANPRIKIKKSAVENLVITDTTSGEVNVFDKFNNSTLDLATAFWGFGVFGSIIVGVVCGVLTEMVGWFFNIPYVILTFLIIIGVWECAESYKKEMNKKSESVVWGVLTQVFCVFSGIGLAGFVFELF